MYMNHYYTLLMGTDGDEVPSTSWKLEDLYKVAILYKYVVQASCLWLVRR